MLNSIIDRRRLMAGALAVGAMPQTAMAQEAKDGLKPAVTPALSAFIAGAAQSNWSPEVLELGKRHVLDTLASIVACHDLDAAVVARRYAMAQSGGATRNAATLLATRDRASLTDAVFANAMAGHAAEINDYSPSAFVQPGPSVVSVSLGLAQVHGYSGHAVLRAVIAGYELCARMPKALGIANLRRAGMANHGIGPTFGCGAAAASLLGLPQARIGDLLSLCSEQASGSWQWLIDTDHIEKAFVFAGMGARNGLDAALMVQAGFTGVRDNLDRKGGWFDSGVFNGPGSDINRAYLIEGLGTRFELPMVGYKRYAAGGPTQAGVHGLLELTGKVDRTKIQHVRIEMPSGDLDAFRGAEMPALNLPYMCGLILADGRLDFQTVQSRQRMRDDTKVRALMNRVELVSDPKQDRTPRVESARVTVTMADGSTQSTFVEYAPGFPANPLGHAEVEAKALELLTPSLGARRAREVADMVWSIDTLTKMDGLIRALAA